MQWLDDPPENWESAPEHPPDSPAADVAARPQNGGIVVQDDESSAAYIFAEEGQRSLDDCA